MRRMMILVALVVAFALPATTSANDGAVRAVALNVVHWNFLSEFGRVWQTMHPAYHTVVSRTFWQSCKVAQANKQAGVELVDVHVVDSYADTLTFPVVGRLHATAVTLTAKVRYLGALHNITSTVYYTKVGGQWKGLWDTATYKAYKSHHCPA